MLTDFRISKPRLARITLLGAATLLSLSAMAATDPDAKAAVSPMDTDNIISEVSALDRTRPFPIADKHAYFTNIKNGDKVKSPFRVSFAVSGMGISPVSAGKIEGTGHHHILIDKPLPVDIKAPIPFDKADATVEQHYKHFGKGETETVLGLPPGTHTLQLLFADDKHVPYYIKSKVISIEVIK